MLSKIQEWKRSQSSPFGGWPNRTLCTEALESGRYAAKLSVIAVPDDEGMYSIAIQLFPKRIRELVRTSFGRSLRSEG